MTHISKAVLAVAFLFLFQGCTHTNLRWALRQDAPNGQSATKNLAVYEPWFGKPDHISVGYSAQDPEVIRKQMDEAKRLDISGFVVDWYGDRQPFENSSYALLQSIAADKNFQVAMMYDETEDDDGHVTDDTLAAFDKFHESYLAAGSPGRAAYLEYQGHPVIFIFPKSARTDWNRVREAIAKWDRPPLLLYEYRETPYANAFDGFYAWINPGRKGWAADGSNWGEDYLRDFYTQMRSKYPDKIAVGGAWAGFNDIRASWSLGRHMSQRCGQTLTDTMALYRQYYPETRPLPFLLIATWNDYEEGTAIERGLEKCTPQSVASNAR
jgi:hypothetical protein